MRINVKQEYATMNSFGFHTVSHKTHSTFINFLKSNLLYSFLIMNELLLIASTKKIRKAKKTRVVIKETR